MRIIHSISKSLFAISIVLPDLFLEKINEISMIAYPSDRQKQESCYQYLSNLKKGIESKFDSLNEDKFYQNLKDYLLAKEKDFEIETLDVE